MTVSVLPVDRPWVAPLRLAPFAVEHAAHIARWAASREALRWLAPSTAFPLTPEKVCGWLKPHTRAFVLTTRPASSPLGYGEINPMRIDAGHFWLGHIVVDPQERGKGLGATLVRRLLAVASMEYHATRVSLVVFPDNQPAIRCYESAGFDRAGEESHRFPGWVSATALLRYEWRA